MAGVDHLVEIMTLIQYFEAYMGIKEHGEPFMQVLSNQQFVCF
jgi:hypothetical protein